jgi:hypothetical protein
MTFNEGILLLWAVTATLLFLLSEHLHRSSLKRSSKFIKETSDNYEAYNEILKLASKNIELRDNAIKARDSYIGVLETIVARKKETYSNPTTKH